MTIKYRLHLCIYFCSELSPEARDIISSMLIEVPAPYSDLLSCHEVFVPLLSAACGEAESVSDSQPPLYDDAGSAAGDPAVSAAAQLGARVRACLHGFSRQRARDTLHHVL